MYALVLHNMGDPARWREAVADLELAFPRYAPTHNYLVHDIRTPLPGYVAEFPFDLIVLNSTFLGQVTSPATLAYVREHFGFIRESSAFKLALPQDEYYCCEELDALLTDWRVDHVKAVCPQHWGVLFPRFLASGGGVELGYTGYITPRMRRHVKLSIPRRDRSFDVVYRATGRPGFPNELAMVKARIGDEFNGRYADRGWSLDISTDDARTIAGTDWWRFLADSRTTLGSNSGSSNLIRNHMVVDRITEFKRVNPSADHREVLAQCVPPEDRSFVFTAISPRAFEAALLETTQMLVPGEYSGLIEAGVHYWPLAQDCSNADEISTLLHDQRLQQRIADACRETLINAPQLQVENFLADIVGRVGDSPDGSRLPQFRRIGRRYRRDVWVPNRLSYVRERIKGRVRRVLPTGLLTTYRNWSRR